MPKHPSRLLIGLALAAVLVSCGPPTTDRAATASKPLEEEHSPIVEAASAEPQEAWRVHTHETGVSISFPPDWSVEPVPGGAVFISPEGARISWEISPRSQSDRAIADPNEWVPNEGGYEIHWSRRVTVSTAEGLEFIWGVRQGDAWQLTPQLMAVLYSLDWELDIRLSTFFNSQSIQALDELEPEEAISLHFAEFEQMLWSIQIAPD